MRNPVIALVAIFALSACGGHGGSPLPASSESTPTTPGQTPAASMPQSSSVQVTAAVPTGALPALFKTATTKAATSARRIMASKHTMASLNLSSVKVIGTLYPGYAGSAPVTSTTSYAPGANIANVTLSFTNAPAGNNEWCIFDFQGVAPDGSTLDLGQLAGLINVGSGVSKGGLNTAATLQYQIAAALLDFDIASDYDLENIPNLSSGLAAYANEYSPDANTGLLSNQEIEQLIVQLAPTFTRTITVSVQGSKASSITVAPDYSQATVKNLASNIQSTESLFAPGASPPIGFVAPTIAGGPISQQSLAASTPPASPYNSPATSDAGYVTFSEYDAPAGTVTIANVYGGEILVGADSGDTLPSVALDFGNAGNFTSGAVAQAGRARGNSTNVSIPIATDGFKMTISDPQGAAFFPTGPFQTGIDGAYFYVSPIAAYNSGQVPNFSEFTNVGGNFSAFVNTKGASTYTVIGDGFSPFGLQLSQLALCSPINCVAANATGTQTLKFPFFDGGTDLAYYNYKVSGAATSIATDSSGGYDVAVTGNAGDLISTTSASFLPNQSIPISNTTFPSGTVWRITLTCGSGTYYNDGAAGSYGGSVTMASLPSLETCQQIDLHFTLPSSVTSQTYVINSL